jgi:hypothetical protein
MPLFEGSRKTSLRDTSSQGNLLSSTLAYNISITQFRGDITESVKRVHGLDIGRSYVYNVFASFKTKTGWTNPIIMIYDTGAVVSLLPGRFRKILGVERVAPIKLSGISPEIEVNAGLTRAELKLHDESGKTSRELKAWIAIAEKDNVPAILGLKDVSEIHDFRVDSKKKMFYLDFWK